ncbi:MAG: 16S rRNA (cytosine(1402)-N(4))-methyltransferase RsmH [Pseudomonadota bacterium]
MEEFKGHQPVLINEITHYLTEKLLSQQNYFADLTFGGGGHTQALLHQDPRICFLAMDQDIEAVSAGRTNISPQFPGRLDIFHSNFARAPECFIEFQKKQQGEVKFQGLLMDLGVSSHQFDCPPRGFSFQNDGPLDMRMDYTDNQTTAAEIVNNWPEESLIEIFREYGEDRLAKKIAQKIVYYRGKQIIKTTKELENIIFHSYPPAMRKGRIHPATRVFQALRIAVNDELKVLADTIPQLFPFMALGGRLAIISFHSLEDRIVKNIFRDHAKKDHSFKILTKKPITPTPEEQKLNPRSRSAKLRILEKV